MIGRNSVECGNDLNRALQHIVVSVSVQLPLKSSDNHTIVQNYNKIVENVTTRNDKLCGIFESAAGHCTRKLYLNSRKKLGQLNHHQWQPNQ